MPLIGQFLDPPHLPIFQPYLDAMRMRWTFSQQVFNHAAGQSTAALILLQDDIDRHARFDLITILTAFRHHFFFFSFFAWAALSRSANDPMPDPLAGSSV